MSVVAGAGAGTPEPAAGATVWLRSDRGRTDTLREVRIRGGEGAAGWGLSVRRRGSGRDEARTFADTQALGGTVVLGAQRGLVGLGGRGWSDVLSRRRAPSPVRGSLARAPVGASWSGRMGAAGSVLGAARLASGEPVVAGRLTWHGWEAARGIESGRRAWMAAWSGHAAGLPVRAEAFAGAGGTRVRAAAGGRAAGISVDAASLSARELVVAGGAVVQSGRLRGLAVRVAVRSAASAAGRPRPWSVAWTRHGGGWTVDGLVEPGGARARSARWRLRAGRAVAEAWTVRVTWERSAARGEPGARVECRRTRGRTGGGVRVELPPGRPRRASMWLRRRSGAAGRLGLRLGWERGRRTTLSLEWSGAALRPPAPRRS